MAIQIVSLWLWWNVWLWLGTRNALFSAIFWFLVPMFVLMVMVFVVFRFAPWWNTLWITARTGEVVCVKAGIVLVGFVAFVATAKEVTHAGIAWVPMEVSSRWWLRWFGVVVVKTLGWWCRLRLLTAAHFAIVKGRTANNVLMIFTQFGRCLSTAGVERCGARRVFGVAGSTCRCRWVYYVAVVAVQALLYRKMSVKLKALKIKSVLICNAKNIN